MLTIGDLTPGITISGAHSEVYFDPANFRCYEFSTVGSGWPMLAYNGCHFWLGTVPLDLADAEALAEVVRGLEPLLAQVADGYSEEWNNSNIVGTLTTGEAQDALEQAREEYAEAVQHLPCYWDVGEWFDPIRHQIAEEVANKGLESWVEEEVAYAKSENVYLDANEVREFAKSILAS